MKTIYKITENIYGIDLATVRVGYEYILVRRFNELTGAEWFELREDNGGGIGGNMDSHTRRYHGWRGTTNNIGTEALGVRQILRIDYLKGDWPDRVLKVKLSDDLCPDLP